MLIFSLLIFFVAGILVFVLLNHEMRVRFYPLTALAFSWIAGMGVISLQMFFYSLAGLRFSVIGISLPWLVGAALCLFIPSWRGGLAEMLNFRFGEGGNMPSAWIRYLFYAIVGVQVLFALISGPSLPVNGWDAWAGWFFRGSVFYIAKNVSPAFLTDVTMPIHLQADYPLSIPLSITWVYTCLGQVDDQLVKILWPIQYFSLLVTFYFFAKELASQIHALFFTAFASLVPILMIHGGGLSPKMTFAGLYTSNFVGYADLPLAVTFLAAGGFLSLGLMRREASFFTGAVFFAGLAAWTKNEGMTFAIATIVLVVFCGFFARILSWKRGLSLVAFLGLMMIPWILYKKFFSLQNEYVENFSFELFTSRLANLSTVLFWVIKGIARPFEFYNWTWYLYLFLLVRNVRRFFSPGSFCLNVLLIFQLGSYILVYLVTPRDLEWHIKTSLDRLVLHLVPLALLISAINFSQLTDVPLVSKNFSGKSRQ
jgi:hypothetical protein